MLPADRGATRAPPRLGAQPRLNRAATVIPCALGVVHWLATVIATLLILGAMLAAPGFLNQAGHFTFLSKFIAGVTA
jgi:hypothetical protein